VEEHITTERVRRYLAELCDTPAPSTAASALRVPVLKRLLRADGVLDEPRLHLRENFEKTGSTAILTGAPDLHKPLWYFAHLDTVSYLIQPRAGDRYPLVPFCYHLMSDGVRPGRAYRFDLSSNRYTLVAEGEIISDQGNAFFCPKPADTHLRPGDRIVFFAPFRKTDGGGFVGHMDNAGGVAALAVAAPVLARAGVECLIALPDEEEGPPGAGNQVMGRGGSRIVNLMPTPDLAIIADVQQAGGEPDADTRSGVENSSRLGSGAVLAEFASLARGAVTPPHLYALAQRFAAAVAEVDVTIQESNNAYTSRSDDVSVLLKTPNILLLGFPGFNRHFDRGEPRANLHDVVQLAKSLVYASALATLYGDLQARLIEADP
jgi:putative aminopeptidase FrvX